MWLFTLIAKTYVLEIFQNLHPMFEKHCSSNFLTFYTDGGGYFQKLDFYLKTHGVEHLVSPHTLHKG